VDAVYMQAIWVLLGLLIGLWLRRLVLGLFALIASVSIVALILMVMGKGNMLSVSHSMMQKATANTAPMFTAIKKAPINVPGSLAGLLCGVAIREVIVLVKS
jgi:hypothetical protein